MRPKKRILLLCQEDLQASMLRVVLEVRLYAVDTAQTLAEAVAWLGVQPVDAILLEGYGENAIEQLDAVCGEAPILWLMPRDVERESAIAWASVPFGKGTIKHYVECLARMAARRRGPKVFGRKLGPMVLPAAVTR